MSRIGLAPITVPAGVKLDVTPGLVKVEGPKGKLDVVVSDRLTIELDDGTLTLARPTEHRDDRAQHGLARTLINNAIIGVTDGYTRNLEIHGVGFRAAMKGKTLELQLGYSHPVSVETPEGVSIDAPEPTKITVTGIDKQLDGQVAADIRATRRPDSYHGKGVRYEGEAIRLKAAKAAAR